MPMYTYTNSCGKEVKIVMTIAEKSKAEIDDDGTIIYEGVELKREMVREQRGFRHNPGSWPLNSTAAGVAIHEVSAAQRESVKLGVPTRFDKKSGDAIFESQAHRKAYCEKKGYHDLHAGYGDPTPK